MHQMKETKNWKKKKKRHFSVKEENEMMGQMLS